MARPPGSGAECGGGTGTIGRVHGQLDVSTPAEYIAALEEPRRADVARLDDLIRASAPSLEAFIRSGMLAYGPFRYRYASGREGDWFRVGVASNKRYISLYACVADDGGYVAERFRSRLPKADIGKSCVRFKRLGDLDEAVLVELIVACESAPAVA